MNDTETNAAAAAHPAPPIPCDVDLRDFRFMPLDVLRLQNSETWALADGWAAKALVNLWTRAWHQVPAGSLPDDDNLHRTWANVPDWESVRNVALRGFVKCSDGRLYHRVICDKAVDAWNKKNASGAPLTHGGKTRKMQRICNAHQMCLRRAMQRICKGEGEGREKERMPLKRRQPGPRKLISSTEARRSSATAPEGSSKT